MCLSLRFRHRVCFIILDLYMLGLLLLQVDALLRHLVPVALLSAQSYFIILDLCMLGLLLLQVDALLRYLVPVASLSAQSYFIILDLCLLHTIRSFSPTSCRSISLDPRHRPLHSTGVFTPARCRFISLDPCHLPASAALHLGLYDQAPLRIGELAGMSEGARKFYLFILMVVQ